MSPYPHSWMYRYILLYFVSFLVGRGAHEWAVSHGIPPCPSEKMATSECCCTEIFSKYSSSKKLVGFKTESKQCSISTFGRGASAYVDALDWDYSFTHTEFSLSAYKRNKRKMELAEKMDTGHNQRKKRRQSSETVSTMLSIKMIWH